MDYLPKIGLRRENGAFIMHRTNSENVPDARWNGCRHIAARGLIELS